MRETIEVFFKGYIEATNTRDPSSVSTVLSPECMRALAPPSFLEAVGVPRDISISVEHYEAQYAKEIHVFSIRGYDIRNLTVDVPSRKCAAWTIYKGDISDGSDLEMQITWFLDFNEDGTKITHIVEFVDSAYTIEFHKKITSLIAASDAKSSA